MTQNFNVQNVKQEVVESFLEASVNATADWESIVDSRGDDVAALRLAPITAIGRIPNWNGGDIAQTEARALAPKTIEYQPKALQARISKYDVVDIPGIASDVASRFGAAIPLTMGYGVAEVFANAFTTELTSYDGLSLCNTAHTTDTVGVTRSNRLGSALDRTSLMAQIRLAREWIDFKGLAADLVAAGRGFQLVVPPALEEVAIEIVESALSSSQMQVNAVSRFNIQILVWSQLADDDDWFLVVNGMSPVKHWVRQIPLLDVNIDEDSRETKITVDYADVATAGPVPDGIFGSSV